MGENARKNASQWDDTRLTGRQEQEQVWSKNSKSSVRPLCDVMKSVLIVQDGLFRLHFSKLS